MGVFIGCSPLYGFHLLLCAVVGWFLGLNRLKIYLAANISNPFMAPLLILAELQTGAWFRRDQLHALTLDAVRNVDPWTFGADLIVGSLVVGGVLGVLSGTATYFVARTGDDDPWFVALVRRAADRYVSSSITAWEFARGKLRGDPLYRAVLTRCALPSGGLLVDVGCGQGLMLALLAEGAAAWRAGTWPSSWPPPAVFERLVGIETRPRVARIARQALGEAATIVEGDARTHVPDRSRVVLFFDVLHMMPAADQEQLLASTAKALEPGGMILIREPDAAAGWRFLAVRAVNTAKAVLIGRWRQTFHFRTVEEWAACFARLGFRVDVHDTGEGTPFANVLFVLTAQAPAST
jgi:SAM-dependent methyltransferase